MVLYLSDIKCELIQLAKRNRDDLIRSQRLYRIDRSSSLGWNDACQKSAQTQSQHRSTQHERIPSFHLV